MTKEPKILHGYEFDSVDSLGFFPGVCKLDERWAMMEESMFKSSFGEVRVSHDKFEVWIESEET